MEYDRYRELEKERIGDAWILFTADHGEELGRRVRDPSGEETTYYGHSRYLFDSSVRVPLLVRPPEDSGLSPRRISTVVSITSIAATVLRAAGLTVETALLPELPLEEGTGGRAFSVARSPVKPLDSRPSTN